MKNHSLLFLVSLLASAGILSVSLYSCRTSKPATSVLKGAAMQKNLGLQLYSIRDSIMRGVPAAIEKVDKKGYKFIEPAGYDDGKILWDGSYGI